MSAQHKLISLIEACTNTAVGFGISLVVWFAIRNSGQYDIQTSAVEGIEITLIFTVVSILRGYALRRVFVKFHRWLHERFT